MSRLAVLLVALLAATFVAACDAAPPSRRTDVEQLTQGIAALPGVSAATNAFNDDFAKGLVYFRVEVDVTSALQEDQIATVVRRYLADLGSGRYQGYRAELDVRDGWNVFTVDSGEQPVVNGDQIVEQARDWVALRREFGAATVALKATIAHPSGVLTRREEGHSNQARLDLPDGSDYASVAHAVTVLAGKYSRLAGLDWKVHAGKSHPAEIASTGRLPSAAELDVWAKLNADQTIPHIDALRINVPARPPVWFSEQTTASRDVSVALQLAARHLPIVAALPAPVLYSASDELSGHIGARGFARGPVSVTVGGCTPYDPLVYLPSPAEQKLIDRYGRCPR